MTRAEVDAWADTAEVELLCADGLDEALIGIGQRFNEYFLVYDEAKVLDILMTRDGMDYEDAREFYEVNIVGAYISSRSRQKTNLTPCFVTTSLE